MAWTINEWFGRKIDDMTSAERLEAAKHSLNLLPDNNVKLCPFQQDLRAGAVCSKAGGVCSIRDAVFPDKQPATVCPNRFLSSQHGENIFTFMANEFFKVEGEFAVVSEVPFLYQVDSEGNPKTKKAGRIDWILIPDTDVEYQNLDWLAIETQAVYFSGASMDNDFKHYLDSPEHLLVPTVMRRPDWRSSGAKRLAPQLDVKAPALRRWGKKVAVVIDSAFFSQLAALPDVGTDFQNSEIIWVVVKYEDDQSLSIEKVLYAELAESVAALQATKPVTMSEFQESLHKALSDPKGRKVHRLSI